MPDKEKKQQAQAANESTAPELNNPDFQVVRKALLAAYQPILEQQLNLAKNPQELKKGKDGLRVAFTAHQAGRPRQMSQ
jgi:hypothetical protein